MEISFFSIDSAHVTLAEKEGEKMEKILQREGRRSYFIFSLPTFTTLPQFLQREAPFPPQSPNNQQVDQNEEEEAHKSRGLYTHCCPEAQGIVEAN